MRAPRFTSPTERPIIAVFGSSTTERGTPAWAVADDLGERLARAGYAVMNGGYQGSMEAVSEGARRGGGPVIGVTTALFNHRPPNPHLTHREDTTTLLTRLDYLVHVASGFVVLEGSIGTLAELFLAWNLLAVEGRPQAPLVCLGRPYAGFIAGLGEPGLVLPEVMRFVQVAATTAAAVALVRAAVPVPAVESGGV
ncbi:MAG: LOG family protein [Candidatus Eisenbacteria bacterium]